MHFPFETSIATVCLSGTLSEKLESIAHAGFDAVEIFENDLIQFEGAPADVRNLTANLGLRISLYQPFRDLEGIRDPVVRRRTFERLERKLQLMKELGADMLLLCSNVGACSGDIEVIQNDLLEAAEMAKRYEIRIAYEALSWGTSIQEKANMRHTYKQMGRVLEGGRKREPSKPWNLSRYVTSQIA
jgi:4-hydroxyphenylpyruvate dioxygenase